MVKASDVINWALIGGGGYILFKNWNSVKSILSSTTKGTNWFFKNTADFLNPDTSFLNLNNWKKDTEKTENSQYTSWDKMTLSKAKELGVEQEFREHTQTTSNKDKLKELKTSSKSSSSSSSKSSSSSSSKSSSSSSLNSYDKLKNLLNTNKQVLDNIKSSSSTSSANKVYTGVDSWKNNKNWFR